MLQREKLLEALSTLGDVLSDRGLRYHVAVVGGAGLLLSIDVARPTQDVDVVAVGADDQDLREQYELPPALTEAALDVARSLGLRKDWLNASAAAILLGELPDGYKERLNSRLFGGLVVSVLGRLDLMRLKVYAAADEGPGSRHVQDLLLMRPTAEEAGDALNWTRSRFPGDGAIPEVDDIAAILERVVR